VHKVHKDLQAHKEPQVLQDLQVPPGFQDPKEKQAQLEDKVLKVQLVLQDLRILDLKRTLDH